MARRILGLVFVNAHNVLHGSTNYYCELLRHKGYEAELFDLNGEGKIEELYRLLQSGEIAFCFAPQGVGSRLGQNGQSFWKELQIPFICLHLDNPCYNIFNHIGDTPYIANLYAFESFVDIHKRFIGTNQIARVLPFQVAELGIPMLPFSQRPIKYLYLKSGESVDECVAKLDGLPHPLRDAIWQQLERAMRDPNLQICDLVEETFGHFKQTRIENFDMFWGCAHWMDMYLRRKRSRNMVEWLKTIEGAVIIGNGWDHIDKSNARATFKPPISLSDTRQFYINSQVICNVTPYGRDIVHERTVVGLLNRSVVISDTNTWWDKNFGDITNLRRIDSKIPLADQWDALTSWSIDEAEAQTDMARERIQRVFMGHDIAHDILACVKEIDPNRLS